MTLDNKMTTNTKAIENIMIVGECLPCIFSSSDVLTPSIP